SPTPAPRPVTSFAKGRPARRPLAFLGYVLGGCPLLFDQLQKRLAAVAQAMAFLEFIEQSDRLSRQLEQHLLIAGGAQPLAVSLGSLSRGWTVRSLHQRTRIGH